MRQHSQRSNGVMATVVLDQKTGDIEHIYVNCHLKHAMHIFLMDVKRQIDPSYSDARAEFKDVLQRYYFVEVNNVTIRRG